MRCTTVLALLTGVMLYLVMGALVFRTLEAPEESLAYKKLLATKQTFLDNKSCVTELEFHKLVKGVMSAVEAGLDVSSLPANFTSRWDLASAFFFCGTIITTIGFGNLSPRTWYGQLFCVCYALVGIPMFGILLAGVGDHMGTVLRRAVAKIETLFLVRMKRKVRPTTVRVISAVLSILIGCLIFLAVPTVVFQKVEEWSFLESLYFVVITLTTVGFGDYVPGGGREGMFFKPLVWLWIVFGLAYFASILTMIGNWLRVLSKRTRAEMEELRAHATDWTQNIQNMSMDFRIPNPLEFNDPFLLQRRRWKRSERRRMRRGAQVTLGHWDRGGSENGHLPNRWAGLSNSMSRLEVHSSLERAVVANSRPRASAAGDGTVPRVGPGLRADPAVSLQVEGRSYHHLLARSFSLPAACSSSKLDSAGAAMQGGSLSGSESPFDSRSDCSSVSSSFLEPSRFQPCRTVSNMEEGGARDAHMNTAEEKDKLIPADKCGSVSINSHRHAPASGLLHCSSSIPPFLPPSRQRILLPSPPLNSASASGCQLLDFFGENLAYIDESSDTLSDRAQPAASEERMRRPRKPKRRSMRRQLSHRWSPLQVRKPNSDMQPPSNPPTPPPDSSLSDMLSSENQRGSTQTL
ncbi:potassium channel subfamily K member 4-like isoform X1 [Micropterus dolomieu]|uniref:potassium channel subfamily K member 4-like isoform X1 n=1 Tax=Micropterus dolomieu TaxID=147949 RepID=UPI001E8CBB9E|nr:potassium channel subfamily K member 4-like isoform X1 [Micropterus dolomieu]XP_045887077.1 potassium channel subfamily K member 4-like isoform X1 [Micropterus dolomieu]XP_045887078.1 potassium channel subfamily K member 4-like isoform X1 [Micropterus dolomieu]XP_045887079.1 potassium channel subfamily K member 4-like isoform X1 [Micropterus dolomieu]